MNLSIRAETDRRAVPLVFDAAGGPCFGWFHAAHAPSRGVGVVMCRPIGYEALCAYPGYALLAEKLAQAGFDVIRFDYHGTGDSAGSDTDPDRVQAWTETIHAATRELKQRSGVSHIALFGLRLGATLAARAAAELGGVDSLVLWAPCVTGRAFARELRAAALTRAPASGEAAAEHMEALGYLYTAQTLQHLHALDCRLVGAAPAKHVLIIGRDDMPLDPSLAAVYTAMGMDTSCCTLPGYASMMTEPQRGVREQAPLERITDWLSAAHPRPAAAPQRDRPAIATDRPIECEFNGVRETALHFGPGESLFGILSEASVRPAPGQPAETAILMLNVGGNYRIGPNRIHVRMARAWAALGYPVFRFDLAGIGDSAGDASLGANVASMYARDSTGDVRAAMDCLASRGCRKFVLMGICSGSYVAFQTALADTRVTGQILMNSRLLEWQEEAGQGGWQGAMQTSYKSADFYRRALMQPQVYRRLLRGEINLRGIAGRLVTLLRARLQRAVGQLVRPGRPDEGVLAKVRRLSVRGTRTLLIMAAEDDGRDYIEFHFGRQGSRLRGDPNFRMVVMDDSDHTFSQSHSQNLVIDAVREHLEQRHRPDPAHPGTATRPTLAP